MEGHLPLLSHPLFLRCNSAIHQVRYEQGKLTLRHRLFVLFLCISGFIHATTMLFDNRLSKEGNDNVEHLYGDILGWYLISIVSIVFGFVIPAISKPKEVSPQKPSEP